MEKSLTSYPLGGKSLRKYSIINAAIAVAMLVILSACGTGGNKSGEGEESGSTDMQEEQTTATATATMEPASGSNVTGQAKFTDEGNGRVRFELTVENISPGEHAVHLHEKGDCSAADASSAGGHWNPTMKPHGKRGDGPCHKGDVGNMTVGEDGKGTLDVTVDGWSIGGPDSTNVVGKAVIVHEKADDFTTQPTGNAGGRLSCGVIK
jgi:Cu-Zn family superoxide dismutase